MKAINLTPALYNYVEKHAQILHPILEDLRAETLNLPDHNMQIAREQGALLHLLAKLVSARKIIEVGCYTGYSTICMGLALGHGGQLISHDIDPINTKIATKYFARAGLSDRITLRLGSALELLPKLTEEWGSNTADMAFIDADKENMLNYYNACLELLRPGGLMVLDNVLWSGAVIDQKDQTSATVAIRQVNTFVAQDERVDRVMLGVADGLYIVRKR